jgi:chromosome segregation ATPase
MRRVHALELERVAKDSAHEQAESRARLDATDRALAAARGALEGERRARVEERTAAAARIDALETLVVARADEGERLRRDANEAHTELAALEAEIAVLRTEVTEMRRRIEEQTAVARATDEQIDRQRALLDRARSAIGELVGDSDDGQPGGDADAG